MWFHRKGNMMQSIAFDCGTSAVRAALFCHNPKDLSEKPYVLDVITVPFVPATYMNARQLKQRTQASIRQIIKKIPSSFQPQNSILGLSSPFYVSKTVQVTHQRQQPSKVITEKEFHNFIDETQHAFEKDAKKQITDGEISTFTSLPQKTHINGYQVEDPVGMTGKTVETSFYFEATTHEILDTIKEFFIYHYPHTTFHVSSVAIANFQALRAAYSNDLEFLVIDIGGEVTEITLSMEGILEQMTSLPMGHMLLLRETASLLNVSLTDASFMINRYTEHTLESKKEEKIKPLILEFEDMWRKKLLIVLTAFTERYNIPPRVFFTGTGVLPFHKHICSEDMFRALFYTKNLSIEIITPDILSHRFGKHPFRGTSDFGLAALTLLGAESVV